MTKRIFRAIILVAFTVLLLSLSAIMGVFYTHFSRAQKERLVTEVGLTVQGVELNGKSYLERLSVEDFRITWIDSEGSVLFDTQATAEEMDNHVGREEVNEAFETGTGESSRYSDTLMEKTVYIAKRLSDGSVIRVSSGQATVVSLLVRVLAPLITIFLLAVLLSAFLAKRMAKRIVNPLSRLNLDRPLENEAYEELSPILGKMNKQHKQIAEQMVRIKQKADEFEQIIASISEGIVLLDEQGVVLSMNPAAKQLFGIYTKCVGLDFFVVERNAELQYAVKGAIAGTRHELRMTRNSKEYQFDVSPITSDGLLLGVVLYIFDITEQALAEKSRQEFSANVSHELKTPLQSIMGSAELMETGLVKAEDMPRFLGNIRREAGRLVTLINDIIHLSELDENAEATMECVELDGVVREAFDVLGAAAEQKNVKLLFENSNVQMNGIRRYLFEIIYNLCDNAIRYNREGGTVTVSVSGEDTKVLLKVADTGIGIATEHHARIFERFYRVDKSHSKETGGTGLGLSIVKHAVQYHGGKLKLESVPGEGTTVLIEFPV